MMVIKFPKLKQWQKDTYNIYTNNTTGKTITIKSPRQCGKTLLLQLLLIYISTKKCGISMFVSPTQQQARKVFYSLCKMLASTGLINKRNDTLMMLELNNGSLIYFKSGEQRENLRGYTITGVLLIDEAAYISDEIIYEILMPMCNVHQPTIILSSTPKYKSGAFYTCYIRGLNNEDNYITIDFTNYDLSEMLSKDRLKEYEKVLPKQTYQSEYLGEFVDGDGSVFYNFKDCITNEPLQYISNSDVYIGVDWGTGTGSDNTVISVAQFDGEYINLIKQVAFNNKTATDTITTIKDICREYKTEIELIVEKNSIGNVYFQLLSDELENFDNVTLRTFVTTNKSKNKIINELQTVLEKRLLRFNKDEQLELELSAYQCTIDSNGVVRYNAALGSKDDRVMSLAFAIDCIYRDIT